MLVEFGNTLIPLQRLFRKEVLLSDVTACCVTFAHTIQRSD